MHSQKEFLSIDKNGEKFHSCDDLCLSGRGVAIISNVMCSGFPITDRDIFCSMIIQN